MHPHRAWGTVTRFVAKHRISRQTVYDIADAGEQVLAAGLKPGVHGSQPKEKAVRVDRNHLVRGVVVLAGAGVNRGVSSTHVLDELPAIWIAHQDLGDAWIVDDYGDSWDWILGFSFDICI